MAIERQIAFAFANAIQRRLNLGPDQAYIVAKAHYVAGSPVDKVFQIEESAVGTDGAGEGGQYGAALIRRTNWIITGWFRFNFDQNSWTQEALTRYAEGIMDAMEKVRCLFAQTQFQMPDGSFLLAEAIRFVSESATEIFDDEQGIFYRKITFCTVTAEDLPDQPTLTPQDIA